MSEFRKASVGPGARTLAGGYYTGDETYRAEVEKIFANGWVCAGRLERLPDPGDYLAVTIGEESQLLVRGEDGTARAFYNVCRHRGARLCLEEQGRLPGSIRCPYHGWTYALDGQLAAAPHTQQVEGFSMCDYPLHQAVLADWEGFMFLNLAPEPKSFARAFAPVIDRFTRWDLPSLRTAHRIEYEVRANWKLIVENYAECYHCPLIQPELVRVTPTSSGWNDLEEGLFLGGYMSLNEQAPSMTTAGHTPQPLAGQVSEEDLSRIYYYALFPNLLLSLHPDYVMAHVLWPQSAGRTRVVCEWYADPALMAQPGFDRRDAVEFWDRTNRQDWHFCELTQLGVGSRAYTPGPHSNQEGLLWAFQREYLRRMERPPSTE